MVLILASQIVIVGDRNLKGSSTNAPAVRPARFGRQGSDGRVRLQ
jgi:hypothetical protein